MEEEIKEAAKEFAKNHSIYPTAQDDTEYGFKHGAKWQAERMYSEEEVMDMFDKFSMHLPLHYEFLVREMFKKK
jgi:hypothetical protein